MHVIRTAMAMANLRDGGIIVIGVSERNHVWELTGIDEAHLGTYGSDDIVDAVASYSSVPPELVVVVVTDRQGRRYLAIEVAEFEYLPCICKRGSPDNSSTFRKGDVLVRPPGKPQTKRAEDANEIRDLLELAAEKRARAIIEAAGRIGLTGPERATTDDLLDQELQGL